MELAQDHLEALDGDTQRGRFLTFLIGKKRYGIPTESVREIIGLQTITRLPGAPAHIKGVINLRGKVIPVTDVRLKFNKKPISYTEQTCIIIADIRHKPMGMIVDNVIDELSLEEGEILPLTKYHAIIRNRHFGRIRAAGGRVKLLLSCETLFQQEEIKFMEGI